MGLPQRKILYVDDENINLMFFALNFKNDFQVLTAASGSEALKMIEADRDIQLVVTDYKMPDMNGLDLIKAIKLKNSAMICLIITGFLIQDLDIDTESKSLVHGYILKPWKKNEVKELFASILQQAE